MPNAIAIDNFFVNRIQAIAAQQKAQEVAAVQKAQEVAAVQKVVTLQKAQKVEQLKNKMAVVSSDPVMDSSNGNISTLNASLSNERQAHDQASSENSLLNNKLSQAKSALTKLQKQYDDLTATKENQETLVAKVDSYLADFNDEASPTSLSNELAQKLAEDLSKLSLE